MSSNWKIAHIEELPIHIGDGNYSSKYPKASEFVSKGVPFITASDFRNGRIAPDDFRFISEKQHSKLLKGHLKSGDVLVVTRGNGTGSVAWVDPEYDDCNINAQLVLLRTDESVLHNRFIYYLLSSKEYSELLVSYASGSAQPQLPIRSLNKVPIRYPLYEQQVKIAKIISALDDKIELNRQINQTLEQIAQAIFKSWFVDFEPVKAKIEAKQNGQDPERAAMCAISGKLDADFDQLPPAQLAQLAATAAHFPDELVDSEQALIPTGWKWSTIGREVDVVGGGTPSTKIKEFWDEGIYNWTTPKDLSGVQEKVLLGTERKITKAGLEKISSGLLPIDTVLLSSRAPVGYLALAKRPMAINQGYIAMKCSSRLPPEYVLQWAESVMDEIKQRASGTTFSEISKKNFRDIPALVPNSMLVGEFQRLASPIYEKIKESIEESKYLSEIRDSLLPKLLSGEIELTGAGHE